MKYRVFGLLVLGLAVDAASARAAAVCGVDYRPNITAFNGALADFYDYGALFMDADSPRCRDNARALLGQKLAAVGVLDFQDNPPPVRLTGGNVYLVMATALKLRSVGLLTADLDRRVQDVATYYRFVKSCTGPYDDTCMDDYATAAAAHAWIAAYEGKTGRDPSGAATQARRYLDLSFSLTESVCVRLVARGDYCTACQSGADPETLYGQIASGQAEVLSYNGLTNPEDLLFVGGENPNYGVGLLTSVAAAVTGLKVIGQDWSPSDLAKVVGQGLVRQGQRRVTPAINACGVAWAATCYSPRFGCQENVNCADPGKGNRYNPAMYPVYDFVSAKFSYDRHDPLYLGGYSFGCFNESLFNPADDFFNDARLAVYRDLAWRWFDNPPTFEPVDSDPPRMWVDEPQSLETLSGQAQFYGWAIDIQGQVAALWFSIDNQSLSGLFYGGSRPDVCAFFGVSKGPDCPVGWSGWVDTAQYPDGEHTLTLVAFDSARNQSTYTRQFRTVNGAACQAAARTIWIQPQWRAGFGPPGSLVLAGSASAAATCGSGGVDLYWRLVSPRGASAWQHVPYSAPVGGDGIWYNSIENADPYAVYETYVTYFNSPASYCTYDGRNDIVWCP